MIVDNRDFDSRGQATLVDQQKTKRDAHQHDTIRVRVISELCNGIELLRKAQHLTNQVCNLPAEAHLPNWETWNVEGKRKATAYDLPDRHFQTPCQGLCRSLYNYAEFDACGNPWSISYRSHHDLWQGSREDAASTAVDLNFQAESHVVLYLNLE